jgi:colicin import membrane protein
VLLVAIGLFWTRTEAPLSIAGGVIEASLVTEAPASYRPPPASKAEPQPAAPPPQPKETPRPQQAETPPQPAPQAPLPVPDTRETERAARLAQQQAEEKAMREEQERRRQEQVLLDEQQNKEAERRERLRQQQLEQEKQLADIRRQREEAERKRRLEAEKLKQLEDQRSAAAPAPPSTAPPDTRIGNQGTDDSQLGRYTLAIQQAVTAAWLRPEHVTSVQCRVRIIQIPGGEVISVTILSPCPTDDLTRRSMEAAVLKAQPLPYRGYESVFTRDITFTFCYPRDRCQ